MLAHDCPTEMEGFVSSIRTISLKQPSVSTNQVLGAIITDIKAGMVDGFDYCHIDIGNVRVFIAVCVLFEDYPASSEVPDVMKHSARAPCPHCFLFIPLKGRPKYCYTSKIYFSRFGYATSFKQMLEQRLSGTSSSNGEFLRMKQGNHYYNYR